MDGDRYRQAMRSLAGGVVILTSWLEGRPWGMTISACCSVSASPPRLLVSVNRLTRCHATIRENGRFGASVLSSEQKHIAEFGAARAQAKFLDTLDDPVCIPDRDFTPRLEGALVHLDCVVEREIDVSDHTLLIGDVERITLATTGKAPLLYFDRAYRVVGATL